MRAFEGDVEADPFQRLGQNARAAGQLRRTPRKKALYIRQPLFVREVSEEVRRIRPRIAWESSTKCVEVPLDEVIGEKSRPRIRGRWSDR